jgi:hypothetical protein
MMATGYPQPPWKLHGKSVQAARLVPIDIARAFVPRAMHIVSVVPGKTLAVLYCAQYSVGSTLQYHELIVAPALIYAHRRVGMWISHIYVDDCAARDGGRKIWGLPKELASFQWLPQEASVQVSRGEQTLCHMEWRVPRASLKMPAFVPALSLLRERVLFFSATGTCSLGRSRAAIAVETSSGFKALQFERSRSVWCGLSLRMVVSAPAAIGRLADA